MIRVLPQTQTAENQVLIGYSAVAVAAVFCLIIFRQCQKTVFLRRRRLRREISKQFRAVINRAVIVAVKREPRIVRFGGCLGQLLACAGRVVVKVHSVRAVGQSKAVARHVYQNRRSVANLTTASLSEIIRTRRTSGVIRIKTKIGTAGASGRRSGTFGRITGAKAVGTRRWRRRCWRWRCGWTNIRSNRFRCRVIAGGRRT